MTKILTLMDLVNPEVDKELPALTPRVLAEALQGMRTRLDDALGAQGQGLHGEAGSSIRKVRADIESLMHRPLLELTPEESGYLKRGMAERLSRLEDESSTRRLSPAEMGEFQRLMVKLGRFR